MSGRIFISYRRADSEGYAGRLYDRLSAHFGDNNVFMDVDTIEPGVDFVKEIEDAVNSCDVLLALIGLQWETIRDQQGKLRLENHQDFVRLEIATALERGIRVIPTLVQGASMPQASTLPENLKPLARRNAIELSYSRFHTDVDKMIRAIERAIETAIKDKFTSQRKSGEGEKLGELNVRQVSETLTEILAENLSLETLGGLATTVIEQGTPIPVRKSETFSTAADNQTAVDLHLLRGVRPMASDNISLGRFRLDGIPPAPRGIPQIEVTFDIDANGILKLSAKDKATGRIQDISGQRISDMSKEESERIRNEAKHFADEDQKRKQLIETRLIADNLVYQIEKALKDLGGKVSANERAKIEASIGSLRQVAQTDDVSRIKQLTDEVEQAFYALSQRLYDRR